MPSGRFEAREPIEFQCPECGEPLEDRVGSGKDGRTFDGVACPNRCNLYAYFS